MSACRFCGICRQIVSLSFASLCFAGCAAYHPLALNHTSIEKSLEPPTVTLLRVQTAQIRHPALRGVTFSMRKGREIGEEIGPDHAAILAVLLNPALRAERNRRGLADAQLIQAGLLPNPQVGWSQDFVTGGNTADTVNAYGITASWDITSVISRAAKIREAKANARSVDLDIAWREWQTAQAARNSVYKLAALETELEHARTSDRYLGDSVSLLRKAAGAHQKTDLELAAAEAAWQDAHATALSLEQEVTKGFIELKRLIGLPPHSRLTLARGTGLPSELAVPSEAELVNGLEARRLDLCALKLGYASQDAKVRQAILAQFPKINLGFNQASDTSNVHTTGYGITIDLPLFDRNQGGIAVETATRQKLFDEYTNRVFEARNDIASALADVCALNRQIAATAGALPSLERLASTERAAVNAHNLDAISYYTALNNLNLKRLQILKLREQLAAARSALEIASGCYLGADGPESASQPKPSFSL